MNQQLSAHSVCEGFRFSKCSEVLECLTDLLKESCSFISSCIGHSMEGIATYPHGRAGVRKQRVAQPYVEP